MNHLRSRRLVLVPFAAVLIAAVCGCHGGIDGGIALSEGSCVTPCQAGLRGDLNGNGQPDVSDAIAILRIVVGFDAANALADCDCDGATGVSDAILLLRCVVGLSDWPLECVAGTVGPGGGTVTNGQQSVRLVVPAGALQTDVDVTISPEATYPANDGFVPGTCYTLGPEGTELAQAGQLRINYNDDNIPGDVDESTLALYKVVGDAWERQPGQVLVTGENTVSAQINGFGTYAILGTAPAAGDERIGPDGQTLVYVPGGGFLMGSDTGDDWEAPMHMVGITGFWIGKCEVTCDQYAAFLNATQPDNVADWILLNLFNSRIELVEGVYQAKAERGRHPVNRVLWAGAVAYCQYYGYRLPTEAEWEFAAGGPLSQDYPWGDAWDGAQACYENNQGPLGDTFEVGSFPDGASWCGALDMAGNIMEWCADWMSFTYYAQSPIQDPTGPTTGAWRVLRGGSSARPAAELRCWVRRGGNPDADGGGFGFRIADGGAGG